MPRLSWYAGRAATMSPLEVMWRARRVGDGLLHPAGGRQHSDAAILGCAEPDWTALLQRFRESVGRPVLLDREHARRVAAIEPTLVSAACAEASRYLAGERAYFGYPKANVGRVVDWSYDPITDYRWPTAAGGRIDHRPVTADPKWIWELNRLQHLPVLAQAWLFTGESRYAEIALEHLDSWLDQNPTGTGTMWRNAFEVGVRVISVAIALQGLRDAPALTPQRYARAVRMLDASARFCWRGRSRFSSANNHLIAELTGVLTVHMLYPELDGPASLYTRTVDALTVAAQRLILPDGAGAEQSISYQIFTAELLSIVVALMRLHGAGAPSSIDGVLERSTHYLISIVGPHDPDPRYGDDDDGFALRLGDEPKRTVRQHLGIVAAATANTGAARYAETTLAALWLATALGTPMTDMGVNVGAAESIGSVYAPNGGIVVLRPGPHRLTVDVGPLGYLSTAAHGHADALAVTLSAEGRELIVDPGTGSYCMNPAWRTAHRGTRAHSTVCVDGADQSVMGGPFYWRRHAETTVRSVDLHRGIVDAEHNGYRRLGDPVLHRRWVIAPPGDPTVVVVDLLDGASRHDVEVSWPLHPDLHATVTPDGSLITRDGVAVLQLCCAATTSVTIRRTRGNADSQLGWWSDRLESRVPAWLVGVHARTTLPVAVLSVLRTSDAGVITAPDIVRDGVNLAVSWSECGIRRGLMIDIGAPGAVLSSVVSSPVRLVSES